ncbi:MAG: Uma2 family endonuclease [Gemmataceae bacterium]
MIIELLSSSTAEMDRTTKKAVYERTFRTPDYFCYDPETLRLEGWRLAGQDYQPLTPNEHGRWWCAELGLWLGTWEGPYKTVHRTWLRFFDPQGQVVPLFDEAYRREAAIQRQRADAAEAELARLKAMLAEQGKDSSSS